MLLTLTLIGISVGQVLVGILSDAVATKLGARSIARALLWLLTLNVASVGFYLLAVWNYRGDVVRAASPGAV